MKKIIVLLMLFASAKAQINTTFDNGDRTAGSKINYNIALTAGDSGVVVVDTPAKSGKALMARCASNDSSTTYFPRHEGLMPNEDSTICPEYFGAHMYFGGWQLDAREGLFFQGKQYDNFPVFGFWFIKRGDKSYLQLVRQIDSVAPNRLLTRPWQFGQVQDTMTIMEIPKFTWIRVDFKVKWSLDYTGQIDVFINRTLVATMHGATLQKTWNSARVIKPRLRLGNYFFGAKAVPTTPDIIIRRVWFDNLTAYNSSQISWDDYLALYPDTIPDPDPDPEPEPESRFILANILPFGVF